MQMDRVCEAVDVDDIPCINHTFVSDMRSGSQHHKQAVLLSGSYLESAKRIVFQVCSNGWINYMAAETISHSTRKPPTATS